MQDRFPYLPLGPLPAGGDGRRRFRVWAPLPREVQLVVRAGDRQSVHPMSSEGYGYLLSEELEAPAGTRYGFYLDGDTKKRYPDPASRYQPLGVHEWSEVVDFPRPEPGNWRGRSLDDAIIYELHVGTFTPEGTFRAAMERLDDLQDLGVNVLELLPLNQTPGDRNWGYDGVSNFALFRAYGRPEDFQAFIQAAHARGIAVLVDVVYNHLGPEGNYLPQFFPVFTDKHHTPWGQAINFDDRHADGVRNYWLQNVRMWLADYGADGLRIDAVHAIKDYSAKHFLQEVSEWVGEIGREQQRELITIAECDLNAPRFIRSLADGGYGMSGQWVDEFHHALHALLTGESRGYYEDFGTLDHLVRALRDGYVYTGQYSPHRGRNFGVATDGGIDPAQLVVFLQNHDQVGNRMIGDRILANVGQDKYLLGAGTYLLSPFTPMIFMGEEYGEENPFPYFVHHGDEALIEAVRKGRAAEFAAFQHHGESVPDPQDEATFRSACLTWQRETDIHAFYRKALHLRAGAPKGGSFRNISVDRAGTLVTWTVAGRPFVCCANFGNNDLDIEIDGEVLLESNGATSVDGRLHLPGWGFAALGQPQPNT